MLLARTSHTGRSDPSLALSARAKRRRVLEAGAELALRVVALTSIASILLILFFIVREALPVLTSDTIAKEVVPRTMVTPFVSADGAVSFPWQPTSEPPKFSLVPLFLGTLKVTLVALAISAPLGVAAAVYVSEYARKRTREWIKPTVELLSGIPSVVVGFFALIVLATWVQRAFGTTHRLNALLAGIGLSFAVVPLVFTVSEDALRAVPKSYRAAAMALGSDRFQTCLRVVIPAAAPGLVAALVLGFGRAVGETLIVVLASGNAATVDASVGVSTRTVTATIAQELGEVVVGSAHYHVLFALGALLFGITFVVNWIGEAVVTRMRRRLS